MACDNDCVIFVYFVYQGMDQEQSQKQYMEILRSWPGYGSTLFDVEVCNAVILHLFSLPFASILDA